LPARELGQNLTPTTAQTKFSRDHLTMTPSLEALAKAKDTPKEISAAYREAKARGLPDGWTCTIDVSKMCNEMEIDRNAYYKLVLTVVFFIIFEETKSPKMDRPYWTLLRFYS